MPISSNTLFHFTNSVDNLIDILENNFIPHYSFETYTTILPFCKNREELNKKKTTLRNPTALDLKISLVNSYIMKVRIAKPATDGILSASPRGIPIFSRNPTNA